MTKAELVAAVAVKAGITKRAATIAVNTVLDETKKATTKKAPTKKATPRIVRRKRDTAAPAGTGPRTRLVVKKGKEGDHEKPRGKK